MTLARLLPVLFAAALLEAGGDALIRLGLRQHALAPVGIGGVVLVLYGLTVNASTLDFGKLLGLYVVVFFLTAQLLNLAVFRALPDTATLAGGALITAGGLVIALTHP